MKIWRLDVADCDEPQVLLLETNSLEDCLATELKEYRDDDRFSGCYGVEPIFSIDENSIRYEPGDGGVYTLAVYFPDTEEGRQALKEEAVDHYEDLTFDGMMPVTA